MKLLQSPKLTLRSEPGGLNPLPESKEKFPCQNRKQTHPSPVPDTAGLLPEMFHLQSPRLMLQSDQEGETGGRKCLLAGRKRLLQAIHPSINTARLVLRSRMESLMTSRVNQPKVQARKGVNLYKVRKVRGPRVGDPS